MKRLFQALRDLERAYRGDPTHTWPVHSRQELVWDFREKTLNGIRFGDPATALEPFGRADLFQEGFLGKSFNLFYGASGLCLSIDKTTAERSLEYFGVICGPDACPELRSENVTLSFTHLTLLPGGLILDESTRRETLTEIFRGEPYRVDRDEDEDIWFFEMDEIEYEFEFEPSGGPLKRINLYPF